ncbi:MAG: hypothetical protein IPN01_11545 [Deltaproteobacteria bacterium]|nr:hypothetical protein [Deltaproteobacteria bacterium]
MSRWFGLSLLLSATLFGCKKEVPPEAGGAAGGAAGGSGVDVAPTSAIDPAVSALAATFAPGELRVTLVNPGAEPRQALRYAYTPGMAGLVQVKTDSDMGMGMTDPTTGQPMELMNIIMPSVIFDIEMAATGLDADNNVLTSSKVSAVGVEERPGSMPGLVDTLTQQLAMIMGMTTEVTVSPSGRLVRQEITPPSAMSPEMAETVKMAEQATQNTGVAFPDEAIGVGAQWTVMNVSQMSPMEVLVTQTVTLESLEGNVATIRFTITQDLVRGDADMMGLPPGSTLEFTEFRGEGAGQLRIDLSQPFVFSGESLVGLQAGFDMTMNGESQSASMTMRSQTTTASTNR